MIVVYQNEAWVLDITLRESLFAEMRDSDPERPVKIKKGEHAKIVKLNELKTLSEKKYL